MEHLSEINDVIYLKSILNLIDKRRNEIIMENIEKQINAISDIDDLSVLRNNICKRMTCIDNADLPDAEINTMKESNLRYFDVVNMKGFFALPLGKYSGETPKQAARKVYSKLIECYTNEDTCMCIPKYFKIFIRESARGSTGKIYGYDVYGNKLKETRVSSNMYKFIIDH